MHKIIRAEPSVRFFATAARVARVTSLAIVTVLALPGMASGQATPGEPTNPSFTVGISGQVVLSWKPPATDGGSAITTYYYRLRETGRRWSSGRPWDDIGLVTTLTITDLTDGTSYDIQVTARNSSGETGIALDFQITPGTTPAAINDLSAAAGNKQATLSWTLPADGGPPITGFQYRQKTSASYGSWMDIPNSGSGTASQTVVDLANSTVYTFQVRAVNDAGEADASNEAEVTTSAAADDCAGGSGTFCSVTLGTSASGSIEVGGDSDWFELMGQVGGGERPTRSICGARRATTAPLRTPPSQASIRGARSPN